MQNKDTFNTKKCEVSYSINVLKTCKAWWVTADDGGSRALERNSDMGIVEGWANILVF